MVKGADEMGVRGSTWESDFMLGAGAPGGVRLPWAKPDGEVKNRPQTTAAMLMWVLVFIIDYGFHWLTFKMLGPNLLQPNRNTT